MANDKVIITAALSGSGTYRQQNPAVPYTPAEFAEEALQAYQAGAAMVHIHARLDDGTPTHEIERIRATYDAIQQKCPQVIINLTSAVGMGKTPSSASPRLWRSSPKWPRSTPIP